MNKNIKETANHKQAHEREHLLAENRFDRWAYGGISYAAQAVAGIALTYWMRYAGGRKIYDKAANWLGPNFVSKITSKTGAEAVKGADSWIMVSTMIMMGNLFLLPLKWVEDRKAHFVEKMNQADNEKREARGEVITAEEKQHQQELLQELKDEPKQSWKSLGLGRAFSLAAVYTVIPLMDHIKFGSKNANQFLEGTLRNVVSVLSNLAGLQKVAQSEKVSNMVGTTYYDGFYSMVSAGGLYVYSHFIQPPKEKQTKKPLENTLADVTPNEPMGEAPTRSYAQELQPRTKPIFNKTDSFRDAIANAQSNQTAQVAL